MRRAAALNPILGVVASLGLATAAHAETCVSATLDRPFPGASEVETRYADIPSPRFPGIWQEGRINGYFYRIWSNEEAVLQPGPRDPAWTISVICDTPDAPCREDREGTPPPEASDIAKALALCLTDLGFAGDTGASAPEPTPAPTAEAPATETGEPPNQAPDPGPCGLAKVENGPSGLTLQRLLVEAGADPGPLDGLPGELTRRALVEVIGASAEGLTEAEAITALDRALCGSPE